MENKTFSPLLKVEGDLVEKIARIVCSYRYFCKDCETRHECKIWTAANYSGPAKEILSLISPHLQAAADKERERIIKWGNEDCPHNPSGKYHSYLRGRRRDCEFCWQALEGKHE